MTKKAYILANFGGPRSTAEIGVFLKALLTDRDVVRTRLPTPLHNFLFSRIAKRRAKKIEGDYLSIGGKSPIYDDTEALASALRSHLKEPILTFHRYLPATHDAFCRQVESLKAEQLHCFPLFPQFTYATTGSIARWMQKHLPHQITTKIRWIKSYPKHPLFIAAHQKIIKRFLNQMGLAAEEFFFLFSAHGVPKSFIEEGDLYEDECQESYRAIMSDFPNTPSALVYQSKFGPGEWLKPYTGEFCEQIEQHTKERRHVLTIPISFTSDHIETLFEVEQEYLPIIRSKGLLAYRLPALSLSPEWIEAIPKILEETTTCNNQMLIRAT